MDNSTAMAAKIADDAHQEVLQNISNVTVCSSFQEYDDDGAAVYLLVIILIFALGIMLMIGAQVAKVEAHDHTEFDKQLNGVLNKVDQTVICRQIEHMRSALLEGGQSSASFKGLPPCSHESDSLVTVDELKGEGFHQQSTASHSIT